jgi:hypothetical protein
MKIKRLIDQIKIWYQGEYISPPPQDPFSPIIWVTPGYYKQKPLAKLIKFLIGKYHSWDLSKVVFLTIISSLIIHHI